MANFSTRRGLKGLAQAVGGGLGQGMGKGFRNGRRATTICLGFGKAG